MRISVFDRSTILAALCISTLAFGATVKSTASSAKLSISGKAQSTTKVGEYYEFVPTFTRANGNRVQFSITNKPSWLYFNANRGFMSGGAGSNNVGTYSNIVISVTDGVTTKRLAPFSIVVLPKRTAGAPKPTPPKAPTPEPTPTPPEGTGSVTMFWTPPLTNTDGSALTNLAGYRIVYGKSENKLDHALDIDTVGVSEYTIENLATGTWFFAVRAYNNAGVESNNSVVIRRAI